MGIVDAGTRRSGVESVNTTVLTVEYGDPRRLDITAACHGDDIV
jgi:hypothetical protein